MNVRADRRAEDDLDEALVWQAGRGGGAGVARLLREWLDGIDAIGATPQLHPPDDDAPAGREIRYYLTRKYGYRIVYEVVPTECVVLAFVRARRSSRAWLSRLTP